MTPAPNYDFIARSIYLGMAAQTQIGVAGDEQLVIDRAVMAVADGAAFPQGFVLEDEGPALVSMTLVAGGVVLTDQSPLGQHDVLSVRAVAIVAGEALFLHGMMVLEAEEALNFRMALVAGRRAFPRVDNGYPFAAAGGHVQAAGSMAGFATHHILAIRQRDRELGMPGVFEILDRFFVASGTGFHPHILRAGYGGRGMDGALLHSRAGDQQQENNAGENQATHP